MLPTKCQDCDHTFLLTPSGMTQSVACPNCGGKRLERDQPSPSLSDGSMSPSNPGIGINQRGIPEQEGIWGATDGGWKPWRKRDESFASVKTADWYQDALEAIRQGVDPNEALQQHITPLEGDERFISTGLQSNPEIDLHNHNLNWTPGQHGRGLFINNKLHTWNAFDPNNVHETNDLGERHSEYVANRNIPHETVDWPSGIEIDPEGQYDLLEGRGEYPYSDIDPRLRPRLQGAGGGFAFGKVAHGPAHQFEMNAGMIHNGNLGIPLSFFDAYINGKSVKDQGHQMELMRAYANPQSPHYGGPITVGVHDPSHEAAVRELIENGHAVMGPQTLSQSAPTAYQTIQGIMSGQIPPPPGIDPSMISTADHQSKTLNMEPYMPWTHEAKVEKESFLPALMGLMGLGEAAGAAGAIGGEGLLGGLMGRALSGGAFQVGRQLVPGSGGGGEGAAGQAASVPPDPSRLSAIGKEKAKEVLDELGHDFDLDQFHQGMNIELEHTDVTHGDPHLTGQIAAAHLKEDPEYYTKLKKVEGKVADLVTPTSNPGYHDSPDGDPHQFKDESDSTALHNPNRPGDGGAAFGEDAVREHAGFGPNSPGLQRAKLLTPLILHYVHSEKSGHDDPIIRALHEQLELENPGYLERGDDSAVEQFLKAQRDPGGVHAKVSDWNWGGTPPGVGPLHAPVQQGGPIQQSQQQPQQQATTCSYCQGRLNPDGSCPQCGSQSPQQNDPINHPPAILNAPVSVPPGNFASTAAALGHCHHCGAVTDASGHCPQCGAISPSVEGQPTQAPNIQAKVAADHQGPVTPEQISAVQQLLIDSGRVEEVPDVPIHPENYAKELSEIANRDNPPPTVDPSQQPPPQPVQEVAPPGATMPMPNPASPQMQQPLSRVAAEPENPVGVPAADQDPQRDVREEQDSSHQWQDTNGEPLRTGETYEMHSAKYEIPDVVQVIQVKPDAIVVSTIGQYSADPENQDGMSYQHEVTHEEAEMDGLTFIPSDDQSTQQNDEPSAVDTGQPNANTEPQPQPEVRSSVQDDGSCPKCRGEHVSSTMSSPETIFHECYRCGHGWETKDEDFNNEGSKLAAWVLEDNGPGEDFFAEMERHRANGSASRNLSDIAARDPIYQGIKERLNANVHEAGKKFTPREQREFIDEDGVARNADKLDLAGTHYETRYDPTGKANGSNVDDSHLFLGL